jgi:hypothetical protein
MIFPVPGVEFFMTTQTPEKPEKKQRRPLRFIVLIGLVIILIGISGAVYLSNNWSSLAADMANPLRAVIGNEGVARLQTFLFTVQDKLQQWEYSSGRKQADAPWQVGETPPVQASPTPSPIPDSSLPEQNATPDVTPSAASQGLIEAQAVPTVEPTYTPTPEKTVWSPQPIPPFGTVEGEGIWSSYIEISEGEMLAARTFLQPDKERPFAYVAVVAFDLAAVRLNFVIGFDEPSLKGGPKGTGIIPEEDFQAGVLLAAFNGGFQTTHGGYGAMQDGFVPLPPVEEAATLAIYPDGAVRMGEWEKDILSSEDMVAYRQNCSMIIHNGEISPRVYNNSTVDWGGTVDNHIVTWRSGIGISEDGNTLYYFVGPSLSMPALADAMLAAGTYQSMLLDINAFWVHFVAVRELDDEMVPEPLLPNDMKHNVERFLKPFPRDFFYITYRDSK